MGVPSTKLRQQPIWCGTIRAVLRYIYRLLAVCVSLLAPKGQAPKGQANIGVLYHKTGLKSSEILKNVRDLKLVYRISYVVCRILRPIRLRSGQAWLRTGCGLCNDQVAVPLFSKDFYLARGIIPKYLRYSWYPTSNLLIQYQQIAAGYSMLDSR